MTSYIRSGNRFSVGDDKKFEVFSKMPAANYIVKIDQFDNYYLECVEPFPELGKLYGDCNRNADRIIRTFEDRSKATGVLLSGERGSGKSLLAKQVAKKCAEKGIPCIIVGQPYFGDDFNKFIQDIEQPAIIFFDEFEKVYDKQKQPFVLSLLDGTFHSNKLFLLTCNDSWRVDENMHNRPGRLFYHIEYRGLSVEFIREYCEDVLINKTHIEKICQISKLFLAFNFDMLKALVEEMNRYDESPTEAFTLLNAKPEYSGKMSFDVEFRFSEKRVAAMVNAATTAPTRRKLANSPTINTMNVYNSTWEGNPLKDHIGFYVNENEEYIQFQTSDLVKVDIQNETFVFENKDGVAKFIRKIKKNYNIVGDF